MIVNHLDMFSKEQTLSGSGGNSTTTLDIKKAGINDSCLYVFVQLVTAGTGLSGVTLAHSADGTTFSNVLTAYPPAVTAGTMFCFPVPQGMKRYIKLVYAGSEMSSVKVNAGFTAHPDSPVGARIGDFAANPNYAV